MVPRSKRISVSLVAALSLSALAGCGYQLAASGSGLPSNANTIYVARFRNYSRQTGLNDQFDRYIKDEIAEHDRLRLVDDPANADLELTGAIRIVDALPAAGNAVGEPTIYQLTMTIDASLMDTRTHKVLWSGHNLNGQEQFAVVPQAVLDTSPQFAQQNLRSVDIKRMTDSQVAHTMRSENQEQAMSDLARDLYASMSEGF